MLQGIVKEKVHVLCVYKHDKEILVNNYSIKFCILAGSILTDIVREVRILHYPVIKDIAAVLASPFLKDRVHGAQTTVCCAVDQGLSNESGLYYEDCHSVTPSEHALNTESARKLWEISEELVRLPKQTQTQT